MTTVLFDEYVSEPKGAETREGELWIPRDALEEATGWQLKAEGVCREDACIPVPPGAAWVMGNHFNVSAFAAHRGQGAVHDASGDRWSFGPPATSRLASGFAPDFELPDFEGRMHRLSHYRGKKVLLMTWASW
jgi:hypothetical protein